MPAGQRPGETNVTNQPAQLTSERHNPLFTLSRVSTTLLTGACILAFACTVDPPPQGECDTDGTGESGETGGGACDETPPDEVSELCADPAFMQEQPVPATGFECEGQAGGAIVYNSAIILGQGGDGSVKLTPPVVNFPGDETVQACCIDENLSDDDIALACESDCGRAACNKVLNELRTAIESSDPSDGACDALGNGNLGDSCRDRVQGSLESWEASLLSQYDKCVEMARTNDETDLPYDDFYQPFDPDRKIILSNSNCNQGSAGCLFDAEVRLFCDITGQEQIPGATCEMAGNTRHPDAPVENMSIAEGGGFATLTRPNNQVVDRNITSMGGTLQRRCDGTGTCSFRLDQFGFELDGNVKLGPVKLINPSATFFDAPWGENSGESYIEFDQDGAYLWVSTVVELEFGWNTIQLPWQFGLQADAPVTAMEGDGEFSLTSFYTSFGGYRLEIYTDAAACTAL